MCKYGLDTLGMGLRQAWTGGLLRAQGMLRAVDQCSTPHRLAHCRCVSQTASVVHLQQCISPSVKLMGDMVVSHHILNITES